MKKTLISLIVFVCAVIFFAWITDITVVIHDNGFDWPKILAKAKGDDNMIWLIFPSVCVIGIIGYFVFNRE